MSDIIVIEKSKCFAVHIVELYKILASKSNEFVMSKQLLRCGTSIGANIAESQDAQSDPDFIAKLYIALKETNETIYWIELLHRTNYISEVEFKSYFAMAKELKAMLTAIIKTKKSNIKKKD